MGWPAAYFTPACQLIASKWAVVELRQAYQPSEETAFPTDMACGNFGLVVRPQWKADLMVIISHPQLFEFESPAAIDDHFYWGTLLMLVAFGPGKLALDSWSSGKAKK